MAWNKPKLLGLEALFFDLRLEKASKSEDIHEVGRLLRNYRNFVMPKKEIDKVSYESASEKAIRRNMTRRSSKDRRNP